MDEVETYTLADAHRHFARTLNGREAGMAIADDEDRAIFMDDFHGGNWYGLK